MRTAITDRLAGALGTAAILTLIGLALLAGLGVDHPPSSSIPPALILIKPALAKRHSPAKPIGSTKRAGRPSPPNLKNRATQIEAPKALALVPTIVVAPKPDVAAAVNTGAAAQVGPGTGADGRGDGSGGGGSGDGDTPPQQIEGRLDFADVPRALRHAGVGGTVRVRYRIEIDGHVDFCTIDTSSGNDQLDRLTCTLIERRFRFTPARDGAGHPVRSAMVQRHIWTNEAGSKRPEREDIP